MQGIWRSSFAALCFQLSAQKLRSQVSPQGLQFSFDLLKRGAFS
jgi:hypothetical protein